MTLTEQLDMDFYIEESLALARLKTASDRALATGEFAACAEVAAAAEALFVLIEDWRRLGEKESWHASDRAGPDGQLRFCALAYVRSWRLAATFPLGPERDQLLAAMAEVGFAIGAVCPNRRTAPNSGRVN